MPNLNAKKRIVGVCGTHKKKSGSSEFLLNCALEGANEAGAETGLIKLADYEIKPCRGCGLCMANKHCPIFDDKDDQFQSIYSQCEEADGFIFSSPVYAISLPSIWKKWLERCDPCTDEDLSYKQYGYEVVKDVKGKAFKGKVVGLIAVTTVIGHEIAWNSFSPVFTCLNLTVVANLGLSLFEYDSQPAIKSKPWSKNLKDAEFAITMSRSLGKRVFEISNLFASGGGSQMLKGMW
jgi:multimeric flavodoxin WrbA